MRRNTPLGIKQLCQIRLLHSPLHCHVREGCSLSLSTEASVCTVETGPGQVMCAALTHVTVTSKRTTRCVYFSASWVSACRGMRGWEVITITRSAVALCQCNKAFAECVKHDRENAATREENSMTWRSRKHKKYVGDYLGATLVLMQRIKVVSEISSRKGLGHLGVGVQVRVGFIGVRITVGPLKFPGGQDVGPVKWSGLSLRPPHVTTLKV